MPRVKMSRADHNPWLAKMPYPAQKMNFVNRNKNIKQEKQQQKPRNSTF
jgi:hypothetical protein